MTCFLPRVSTVILCCLGVSLPTFASPPFSKLPPPPGRTLMGAEGFRPGSESRSANGSVTSRPSRLDLRPPTVPGELAAAVRPNSETVDTEDEPRPFPSARHGEAASTDQTPVQSSDMGISHVREMGRVETLARRFHREGLPVARLWETHSALLSLGLNQKGKPGLWLVQKTH
jgi:hypothetical protein